MTTKETRPDARGIAEAWIRKDLETFADRGSVETAWDRRGRGDPFVLSARWNRGGTSYPGSHRFTWRVDPNSKRQPLLAEPPRYQKDGGSPIPYRDFLWEVGELDSISKAIEARRMRLEAAKESPGDQEPYIHTKARVVDVDGDEQDEEVSEECILRLVRQNVRKKAKERGIASAADEEEAETRVVFVKGDAGAGKTTLLEQLRDDQALKFDQGAENFLFFYVSAQGRALSSLEEAISWELDELRSFFSHQLRRDAVATLTRNGLIVPIVDGFDELLGVQGYGDAFGSLKDFLEELEGEGAMVVSARSAFYEAEFVHRHAHMDQERASLFEVVPVELQGWETREQDEFFEAKKVRKEARKLIGKLSERDQELLQKPFFVAKFHEYVMANTSEKKARGFHEFLMEAYLDRESGKFLGDDKSPLLSPNDFQGIFELIAEEMWHGGDGRALKKEDLQTIVKLILENATREGKAGPKKFSDDAIGQMAAKITSAAGIRHAEEEEGRERFRFEHEVYFEYFLSPLIRKQLSDTSFIENPAETSTLDLGIVPAGAIHLATQNMEDASATLEMARRLGQKDRNPKYNLAINLGELLVASLSVLKNSQDPAVRHNITVKGAVFREGDFRGLSLVGVRFINCWFIGGDFSNCSLSGYAKECQFTDKPIIVNNDTALELEGLEARSIFAIRHLDKGGTTQNHLEIADIIGGLGGPKPAPQEVLPRYSADAQKMIDLLPRVAGALRSRYSVAKNGPTLKKRVLNRPGGSELIKLLIEYEIIDEYQRLGPISELRAHLRNGPNIRSVDDVLKHETTPDDDLPNDKIGAFWQALREIK